MFRLVFSFFLIILSFVQRCVQSCGEKDLELIRDIKTQIKEKENVFFDMEAYLPKKNGWVPPVRYWRVTQLETMKTVRCSCQCVPAFVCLQALPEFGPGQRERNAPQQPGKVSDLTKPEESGEMPPWIDFNLIFLLSSIYFIQIRLQGRVWKVQAVYDDNPDVWSNNLPLLSQLSVRKH